MHGSNKVPKNKHSGDENFMIVIDNDDDDTIRLIAMTGLMGLLGWLWHLLRRLHLMRPLNL
jgi:hypothetical protein